MSNGQKRKLPPKLTSPSSSTKPGCRQSTAMPGIQYLPTMHRIKTHLQPRNLTPDSFLSLRQGQVVFGNVLILEKLRNFLIVRLCREPIEASRDKTPEHRVTLEAFVDL